MDVDKIVQKHGMMQGWILMTNQSHFLLLHTDFECKSDLKKREVTKN